MKVLLFLITLVLAIAPISSFSDEKRDEIAKWGQRVGEVVGTTVGTLAPTQASGAALGAVGSQAGGAAGRVISESLYNQGTAIRDDINRDPTGGSERLKSMSYDAQMHRANTQ